MMLSSSSASASAGKAASAAATTAAAAAAKTAVKTILGTMTFGGQTSEQDALIMVTEFVECMNKNEEEKKKKANLAAATTKKKKTNSPLPAASTTDSDHNDDTNDDDDDRAQQGESLTVVGDCEIDTAIMYQNGKTEQIIGRIMKDLPSPPSTSSSSSSTTARRGVRIASKANPFTRDKDLSPIGLRAQLDTTLKSLQAADGDGLPLDLYYLHAPDAHHNIEPTLEEIQKQFAAGKFKRFGLSNFAAWEVVYIHQYMSRRRGYVVPTVYQGMYNGLARQVETGLFPALHKLGIAFYAYNPLAAGMLTGKYNNNNNHNAKKQQKQQEQSNDNKYDEKDPKLAASATTTASEASCGRTDGDVDPNSVIGTRFAGTSYWARRYRDRYQQREQFDAVDVIQTAVDTYNSSSNIKSKSGGDDDDDEATTTTTTTTILTMTDASLRWLKYHSFLRGSNGDGIILGASTLDHFRTNLHALEGGGDLSSSGDGSGGPLPPEIVKAFDDAWAICKDVCPDYSRGYSGSALLL